MESPRTISKLHDDLRSKKYSLHELVEHYLAKIEENKELNAFLTVSNEYAYRKAKEHTETLENNRHAFEEFPLLGVVVSLKDIFLMRGIRTTAASKVLEDYIPQYSATVVKKLEDAGAIVIGKVNLDAWAHGSSGENSDFGPSKNPWNPEFVPGGSSSGSAVSVAAGLSLAATATDTCGSTRLPANYCGLVGLKPTYGAVSRYGVIAMASSLDSMGHITITVEDSRRIFDVTRGEDGFDSTVKNMTPTKKVIKKIGIPKEFFAEGLSPVIRKNIDTVIETFKNMGIEFSEISLPHTKYGISVYYIIQPAEVSSNLGRYDGVRFGNSREFFGTEAKRRILLGTHVLSSGYYDAYYGKAMKVRSIIIKELSDAYENVDAILAPVAPTPPFKIGEKVDDPLSMYLTDIYAATANLSGTPSLAIPSGFTDDTLPLGFQLMGPRFSEHMLFDLGEKYQKETNWHTYQPK